MIVRRPAGARGHTDLGWLDSRHTFSFGEYHDDQHMGFRALRVINEDRVKADQGFGTHGHRDMEILSWVLEGELSHKDSLGNGSIIRPGELQRMTAGTGVLHSEMNPSPNQEVHFLQIWLLPEQKGLPPGYEQKAFEPAELGGRFRLIASRDGRDGSVTVRQDVDVYAGRFTTGQRARLDLRPGRHAWVHVARGCVVLNDRHLADADGAALSEEVAASIHVVDDAEVLVFDLA
jgi:redox-sensitive bicupin YhaK (pirin superfamily)